MKSFGDVLKSESKPIVINQELFKGFTYWKRWVSANRIRGSVDNMRWVLTWCNSDVSNYARIELT